jgi:hypothetical protein
MPRHPPNALTTLNRSHCQCSSSGSRFIRNGNRPGYLLQPSQSNNAIDVFDRITLLELRRAVRLCPIFKTSFSRLNPGPRGQATAIKSSVRCKPEGMQTTTTQSDKLPSYLQSLFRFRPARPFTTSLELGSDIGQNPTPGSLQINLLFTIYAEQASDRSRCKLLFLQKTLPSKPSGSTPSIWWS